MSDAERAATVSVLTEILADWCRAAELIVPPAI
jgi:hypothetical protein